MTLTDGKSIKFPHPIKENASFYDFFVEIILPPLRSMNLAASPSSSSTD